MLGIKGQLLDIQPNDITLGLDLILKIYYNNKCNRRN